MTTIQPLVCGPSFASESTDTKYAKRLSRGNTWKTLPASVTAAEINSLSNAGGAQLLLKERKVQWKE